VIKLVTLDLDFRKLCLEEFNSDFSSEKHGHKSNTLENSNNNNNNNKHYITIIVDDNS
jgi:hypothetical protein